MALMKSSVDCSLRLELPGAVIVLSSGAWTVDMSENHKKKQQIALGNQVRGVSADRKVSVIVVLSTLVGSSVGRQWCLSS